MKNYTFSAYFSSESFSWIRIEKINLHGPSSIRFISVSVGTVIWQGVRKIATLDPNFLCPKFEKLHNYFTYRVIKVRPYIMRSDPKNGPIRTIFNSVRL